MKFFITQNKRFGYDGFWFEVDKIYNTINKYTSLNCTKTIKELWYFYALAIDNAEVLEIEVEELLPSDVYYEFYPKTFKVIRHVPVEEYFDEVQDVLDPYERDKHGRVIREYVSGIDENYIYKYDGNKILIEDSTGFQEELTLLPNGRISVAKSDKNEKGMWENIDEYIYGEDGSFVKDIRYSRMIEDGKYVNSIHSQFHDYTIQKPK
jgi:hypothetical protein